MAFPNDLKPKGSFDLIRIGNDNDGGYLVDKNSVLKSKSLIAMGISTDWSFEKAFFDLKKVPIHCYDHTLTNGFLIMFIIKSFLKIFLGKFKGFIIDLSILFDYQLFFRDPIIHFKDKIGCKQEHAVNISEALSRLPNGQNESVFIKMDIERSEYRVLDELIDNCHKLTGLVIEFHDADLHVKRISEFVKAFTMELIHSHANNNWSIGVEKNTQLLELTFSNHAKKISEESEIPNKLDQINNLELPGVDLEFK
tara:strand:+ start:702 stop:1460 length:759 start_codon:yes stop_codon:yes gene_type:complete